MKIDFFTFLSYNSSDYAEFLKYTCDKFLSGKHKINWKCIESVGFDRVPEGYKLITKAKNMEHVSMNHAAALNLAQKHIESDYVIFIDADMAILYKNWDDVIINELNEHDCFGVAFPNRLKKYRNFPSVYLFAFRSHILNKVKLDFSPKYIKGKRSTCDYAVKRKEAKYFGIRAGKRIHCDTGWKIPSIILDAGFTSNVIDATPMISENSILPFEDEQHRLICMKKPKHMTEWHYKNKIFATHKQASRNHSLNSELGSAWKKRVDLYIKQYKEGIL